ncbi:hypothetical protein TVAGG3_0780700 [Trichomonas vaginalis G3]|uniref:hypothetical protein n=1 Tax=Trichomonas vaginalis (strain ATCC PRA-98 / G3) TaxID=412133 RepID=UPI0021E56A89|nr:hypothetical protein TVAGG3_0780700 [Trichomonas vaginalis G3]KAI5495027.1 hypothetical protein TVAGG3_0780700 [Trichomonas vaginalis G3]
MIENHDVLNIKDQENLKLETVLVSPEFLMAWNINDEDVIEYVTKNIEEIERYAFLMKPQSEYMLNSRCLTILQCQNKQFYKKIFRIHKFFDVILEYAASLDKYTSKSHKNFFDTISYFIMSSGFIFFKRFDFVTFFSSLCDHLNYEPPAEFIKNVLRNLNFRSLSIFKHSTLINILIDKFTNQYSTENYSLSILIQGFQNEYFIKLLIDPLLTSLDSIINTTLENKSKEGVIFIAKCFSVSFQNRKISEWKKVREIILNSSKKFLETLKQVSCIYDDCVCRLLLMIYTQEEIICNSEFIDFSRVIIKSFILCPQNSFLANYSCRVIRQICRFETKILISFIYDVNLVDFLISVYTDENQLMTCNWNQIRDIANTISPYINLEQNVEWNRVLLSFHFKNPSFVHISHRETNMKLVAQESQENAFEIVWNRNNVINCICILLVFFLIIWLFGF